MGVETAPSLQLLTWCTITPHFLPWQMNEHIKDSTIVLLYLAEINSLTPNKVTKFPSIVQSSFFIQRLTFKDQLSTANERLDTIIILSIAMVIPSIFFFYSNY